MYITSRDDLERVLDTAVFPVRVLGASKKDGLPFAKPIYNRWDVDDSLAEIESWDPDWSTLEVVPLE